MCRSFNFRQTGKWCGFREEPCRGVGSFGGANFVAAMLVQGENLGFWVRIDGGFGNLEEPGGSVFFFFPASTLFFGRKQ